MKRKKSVPGRPEKRGEYGKKEGRKYRRKYEGPGAEPAGRSGKPGSENKQGRIKGHGIVRGNRTFGKKESAPARPFPVMAPRESVAGDTREKASPVIIYGVNPILEAFRAGRGIEKLFLAEKRGGREVTEIINLARGKNIKVSFEPRESLSRMSKTENHQGVVAVVAAGRYSTLEEIIGKARSSTEPAFILILDGIQDPQNLGAVIRSAVCAGAHGIVIPKDRAAGLTAAVDKASAGALEHMPVAKVTNIAHTLDELKKEGLWIIGAEGKAGGTLYSADFKGGAIGLVIGSEGEGIRPLVAKKCDMLISIPIKGKVSSLNASAAAAVVMYEVVRQRGNG